MRLLVGLALICAAIALMSFIALGIITSQQLKDQCREKRGVYVPRVCIKPEAVIPLEPAT